MRPLLRPLGEAELRYFVPMLDNNYYHFVTETLLTLYELLHDHDQLERREARLWYQGRYRDVLRLFSVHPITVLPLEPGIQGGSELGDGVRTLKADALAHRWQFDRLLPLSDYLMSTVSHVPEEPGVTLIRRADKRLYEDFDELHAKVGRFGLPVRVAQFEAMSFAQQITLARNTKVMLAPHGAGAVNQIFMPRGSKVLELYPRGYFNWHTGAIASAFGHQYAEIEATTTGVIGRMRDARVKEYLENNPWPTRAQTKAMTNHYDRELMRSVRDVASYSIDPDLVIEEIERMLGAKA